MKPFRSIRTRLTVSTMFLITAIFAAVLSFIMYINIRAVHRGMAKTEHQIHDSLIAKGNTLIRNNSIAMTGMAADNAFTAIRDLVASTVREDPDIVYGVYMDHTRLPWVNASPENPGGDPLTFVRLDDEAARWAQRQKKQPAYREYRYRGEKLIEFAAPVFVEDEVHGFIRYGLSTETMRDLLREARAENLRTRNEMVLILSALGLFSMTVSYLSVRRLSRKITHPVASLVESTRIIAGGNYDVPITSDSTDEIGLLVQDVDSMRVAIRRLMDDLKEQERLKNEMELARRIQTVLLPEAPEIPGYEISAGSDPADEVGGDYFDVISAAGFDWVVVGDVSGHGVTSGLVMMMVQTAIHTVLEMHPDAPPSQLLAVVNRIIYENIRKMDEMKHMTIVVLVRGTDGSFFFSGLHEDILVRRAATGRVEEIETDGFWIGMEPDISAMLSTESLTLAPGDYMILFTDGVTEARCDNGMFGNVRLKKTIEKSGAASALQIREDILAALKSCRKPDDVTLMVLKRLEQK